MVRVPGNIKRVKQNQGYVAKLPTNPASFLKPGEVQCTGTVPSPAKLSRWVATGSAEDQSGLAACGFWSLYVRSSLLVRKKSGSNIQLLGDLQAPESRLNSSTTPSLRGITLTKEKQTLAKRSETSPIRQNEWRSGERGREERKSHCYCPSSFRFLCGVCPAIEKLKTLPSSFECKNNYNNGWPRP
jgi:hypothetical protein